MQPTLKITCRVFVAQKLKQGLTLARANEHQFFRCYTDYVMGNLRARRVR
jgi:hypothetical protein